MQVAEILSDLTSLRVCGHSEALALVNVPHQLPTGTNEQQKSAQSDASTKEPAQSSQNPDLQRARDLVELHNDFKLKHRAQGEGLDEELQKARKDVSCVLRELKMHR